MKKFIAVLAMTLLPVPALAGGGFPPPKRYDYKFPGRFIVEEVPYWHLPFRCGLGAQACVYSDYRTYCHAIVADHISDREWREKVRHEQGHCNGWKWYHPK
jgi:hypothetical protein